MNARSLRSRSSRYMRWGVVILLLLFGFVGESAAKCLSPAGDINQSGKSDILDTQCMLVKSFGAFVSFDCAGSNPLFLDLNCDGSVDVQDTLLSIQYSLSAPLGDSVDSDGNNCPDTCDDPILGPGPEPFCDVKVPVGSSVMMCEDFNVGSTAGWLTPMAGTDFSVNYGVLTATSVDGIKLGLSVSSYLEGVSSVEFGQVGLSEALEDPFLQIRLMGMSDLGKLADLGKWTFSQGISFAVAGHAGVSAELESFVYEDPYLSFDVLFPATIRMGIDGPENEEYLWIELTKEGASKYFGPFPCQGCQQYNNLAGVELTSNFSSLSMESFVLYGNGFDFDADGDGVSNENDNCVDLANPNQSDMDGDQLGDLCDPDVDADGVINPLDNCPMLNAFLLDAEGDGCIDTLEELPVFVSTTPLDFILVDEIASFVDAALLEYLALGPGPEPFGPGPEPFAPVFDHLLGAHTLLVDNALLSPEPGLVLARAQHIEHLITQFHPEFDLDDDGVPDEQMDNCPTVFNPAQMDRDLDGEGDRCDFDSPLGVEIFNPMEVSAIWGNVILDVGETLWSPDLIEVLFYYDADPMGASLPLQLSLEEQSNGVGTNSYRWSTFNLPTVENATGELTVAVTDQLGNHSSSTLPIAFDQKHDTFFDVNIAGFSQSLWTLTFDATDVVDPEGEDLVFDWEIDGVQYMNQSASFEPTAIGSGGIVANVLYSFLAKLAVTDPDGIKGTHEKMVHVVFNENGDLVEGYTGDVETGLPYCGCESIVLKTGDGMGIEPLSQWYPSGVVPLGPSVFVADVLDYLLAPSYPVQMAFEVDATLVPGSDPALCEHVQTARRTAILGERVEFKTEEAGLECPVDGPKMCFDGFSGWKGEEPLEKETDVLQIIDGHLRWVDTAGTLDLPSTVLGKGFSYEASYYATVGGDAGKCQCTWDVDIEVDMNGVVQANEIQNIKCTPSLTPSF